MLTVKIEKDSSLDTLLNYFKMKLPKEYKEHLTKTMIWILPTTLQ